MDDIRQLHLSGNMRFAQILVALPHPDNRAASPSAVLANFIATQVI